MSVWGNKLVYRKLGYVADFCQICISARPFILERIGSAKHIINLPLGAGEVVDYQRVCLHCSTAFRADPQQYANIAKFLDTIEPLMLETFPDLAHAHAPRLELEQQIRTDPASIGPAIRSKLLLEPFILLSPRVAKRFETANAEVAHGFLRRDIIPLLSQTLARLRPTETELQATLTHLVQTKDLIGAKIKLADLIEDLNARYDGKRPELAINPIKDFSSGGKPPYRVAATIFKVLGWLTVIPAAFFIWFAVRDHGGGQSIGILIGVVLLFAIVPASMFLIYWGLEWQKKWARIWGIILAIAVLFAFPIGTVLGAYIIWALTAGWET
jgi:hypothetical protein